jgi:hypothetical protein
MKNSTTPAGETVPPRPVAVTVAVSVTLPEVVMDAALVASAVLLLNCVIQVLLFQFATRLAMFTLPSPVASL